MPKPMTPRLMAGCAMLAAGLCLAGCRGDAERAPAKAAASATASASASAPVAKAPARPAAIKFSKNDVVAATERAKKSGKPLLVDAWAPWCHTCLSMKHYVFTDPSLAPAGKRVEAVAIDTDQPVNAAFLERYDVRAWPTFFVIDPADGAVLGTWPGSASAKELRAFVEQSIDVFDAHRKKTLDPSSALALLVQAKAAHAKARYADAAKLYEKSLAAAKPDWPRRSEALLGWVTSLYHDESWVECARVGRDHVESVTGAAIPADFINYYWGCMTRLAPGPKRKAAQEKAVTVLRAHIEKTSSDMSVDDRSDALAILARALKSLGDAHGARRAHEKRVKLMENAAEAAPTPQIAQTYDYARANAYVALGRPHFAIEMLRKREKELPDSYEPPARLASVLVGMHRWKEALVAIDRALAKSYGPRKLRYLETKRRIQGALRDRKGQLETMKEEIALHESLKKGQADHDGLEAAKKRLEAAQKNPN